MTTPFVKMHGAGNDFVMIDDRQGRVPWQDHVRMAALAARRTGVGCEGIILIQPSDRAAFRMRFLNPDGSEVEMCGNGARCAARYAHEIGAAGRSMTMETLAGLVDAELVENGVRVWMPEPNRRRYNLVLDVGGRAVTGHALHVGVPHVVVPVEDVARVDVDREGAVLRRHAAFAPEGTNVNFVRLQPPSSIQMRTYERGVEAESGACGTGAVATTVVAVETAGFTLPVRLTTTAGFELLVDGDWRNRRCTGLTLTGPASFVFRGEIDLDGLVAPADVD
jgi:diaminopimelate epimerase